MTHGRQGSSLTCVIFAVNDKFRDVFLVIMKFGSELLDSWRSYWGFACICPTNLHVTHVLSPFVCDAAPAEEEEENLLLIQPGSQTFMWPTPFVLERLCWILVRCSEGVSWLCSCILVPTPSLTQHFYRFDLMKWHKCGALCSTDICVGLLSVPWHWSEKGRLHIHT